MTGPPSTLTQISFSGVVLLLNVTVYTQPFCVSFGKSEASHGAHAVVMVSQYSAVWPFGQVTVRQ